MTAKKSIAFAVALNAIAGASFADQTLTWWHIWPTDASGAIYEKYKAEFEAEHPDVKIEMVYIPETTYFQKLVTSVASGDAPDIFALSYRNLYDFKDNKVISPIDTAALAAMGHAGLDEFKADWAPGVLEAYELGGAFYGVPLQFNIYAYVINADHFREAGLDPAKDYPKTWEELYDVGQKLTIQENGRVVRQGASFPFLHSAAWYLLELEPVLRELGGSILNEDQSESLINSEAGVKAMEAIKKRFDLGITDKTIAAGLDYYNEGFPSGNFSMTIAGNWGIPRWQKNFPDIVNADTFMAIPTPTFEGLPTATSTTSWAWSVYSGSENKDLAWEFANFLTSQPNRHLEETGDIIPRAGWSESEAAKAIPQAEFWEEMLQHSAPLAKIKEYSEISDILKSSMQDILMNDSDIQATLDKAKAAIDTVLKDG